MNSQSVALLTGLRTECKPGTSDQVMISLLAQSDTQTTIYRLITAAAIEA